MPLQKVGTHNDPPCSASRKLSAHVGSAAPNTTRLFSRSVLFVLRPDTVQRHDFPPSRTFPQQSASHSPSTPLHQSSYSTSWRLPGVSRHTRPASPIPQHTLPTPSAASDAFVECASWSSLPGLYPRRWLDITDGLRTSRSLLREQWRSVLGSGRR